MSIKRNPVAAALCKGQFKHKIVRNKTKYTRKVKHKRISYD